MRVDPSLTLSGSFWLPATTNRKLPGTLRIDDGGKAHLEIVGRLDSGHPFNAPRKYERVIGEVIQHGFITLEQCFLTSSGHHGSGAPYKHQLEPGCIIVGAAYDDQEPVLFNELRFSIEGLDEWLATTGISANWLPDPEKKMRIDFTPPEKRELWRNEHFKLSCEFDWSVPTTALKSAEINQTAFLRLRSEIPTQLDAFTTLVHQLAHLVAFAVDANVSVQSVSAYADAIKKYPGTEEERPLPLPIYYESLTFSAKPTELREIDRLFKLADLPVSSQAAIEAWFRLHQTNSTAANLYFSTRKTKFEYLNIQFLLLAQSIEVYHRNSSDEKLMPNADFKKLKKHILDAVPAEHRTMISQKLAHGNDLTLADRLERLMAPFDAFFGDAASRATTIRSIVGTRNHYTHWGKSDDGDEHGGLNLWTNLKRLDMLMQMQLLRELGYTVEQVVHRLEKNLPFKRHENLLKPPVVALAVQVAKTPSSTP